MPSPSRFANPGTSCSAFRCSCTTKEKPKQLPVFRRLFFYFQIYLLYQLCLNYKLDLISFILRLFYSIYLNDMIETNYSIKEIFSAKSPLFYCHTIFFCCFILKHFSVSALFYSPILITFDRRFSVK